MNSETSDGCFALVLYVPEPLSGALQLLRVGLPEEVHSAPHVTVLPPRPLTGPIAEVSAATAQLVSECAPFQIELEQVCSFPDTNVLYLSLGAGYREIKELHDALASEFEPFQEEHEFWPHLTLAGPMPPELLGTTQASAEKTWANFASPRNFVVDRIDFLWLRPGCKKADWQRIWSKPMSDLRQSKRPA